MIKNEFTRVFVGSPWERAFEFRSSLCLLYCLKLCFTTEKMAQSRGINSTVTLATLSTNGVCIYKGGKYALTVWIKRGSNQCFAYLRNVKQTWVLDTQKLQIYARWRYMARACWNRSCKVGGEYNSVIAKLSFEAGRDWNLKFIESACWRLIVTTCLRSLWTVWKKDYSLNLCHDC